MISLSSVIMDPIDWGVSLALTVVFLTIVLVTWRFKYHFGYWKRRSIPHLPPVIPKGNMTHWLRSKHYTEIFNETYEAFSHTDFLYAGFYFNMQRAAIALNLEFIKLVLVNNFNSFENRNFFHNEKSDPLTGNLLLLDGPKWRLLRSKLSPTFAGCKMKHIFPTMLSVADDLRDAFEKQIALSPRGIFDVNIILRQFSCDVIANCVYGLDSNSMADPKLLFSVMAQKMFTTRRHIEAVDSLINCFPDWARFLRMKVIPKDIANYFMNLTKTIIAERENSNASKPNYLDVLVEHNKNSQGKLTLQELTAQVFVFFMTAFDTCASTVSYALFELARYPDIQNRLRQEINKVLRTHKNKLTYECVMEMKYLDNVISETLRKYPVMPALFRRCTKQFVPPDRPLFHVEKGCLIIIPTYSLHHDPSYFPDPFLFDPERFSAANMSRIRPFSYLPFGEGQRGCIGQRFGRLQTSIGLLKLITKYKFEICRQTRVPPQFSIVTFNVNPTFNTLRVVKI